MQELAPTSTIDALENDDILVDVEFTDGTIHQVKLVDSRDFIDQNSDRVKTGTFIPGRRRK